MRHNLHSKHVEVQILRILIFTLLAVAFASQALASHLSFAWDAPTTNEDGTPLTDLSGYRVYTCAAEPCTLATAIRLAEVLAPTTALVVPHGRRGFAFVTAFDTSFNESGESNVIPFDTLRPASPGRMRVQ